MRELAHHDVSANIFCRHRTQLIEHQKIAALCRRNLSTVVDDDLRERLTPDYEPMCLIVSPDFYEKIQRPHVIGDLRNRSVHADWYSNKRWQRNTSLIVTVSTGFRSDRFIRPTRVIGADHVDLDDVWSPAPLAYLSAMVPGFNLFMLNGPNGPSATSL